MRWALLLFWPLAVVVLLRAIAGRLRDPGDLLLILVVVALLSLYLSLLFTAGWRARLRWELDWAEAYRRNRLEIERQLMSPQGYAGYRAVANSDGSQTLIPTEPGAGAA
jgi:hypothetical protein